MKKIKIFIGSSIDDLAYERRDIVSFIAELNNQYIDKGIYIEPYICEEKSNEMRPDGSQKVHNDYIKNNADATIFMFYQNAGKYTLSELDIARKLIKEDVNKKLHILVFFKTKDGEVEQTTEIKAAVDKIAKEYAHYYKKFSHPDTIKLEILQYISTILGEGTSLAVDNGRIHIGDIIPTDISLDNVYAYQNSEALLSLKKDIDLLEHQIQDSIKINDWVLLSKLTKIRENKVIEYEKIQIDILKILKQLFADIHSGNADPTRLKALSLVEEGKYKEAQALLPLELIETKSKAILEQKSFYDSIVKTEAVENIKNAYTRIDILSLNGGRQDDIEKTYDSIFEIAPIANDFSILIIYIDFLIDIGKSEKALLLAQRVAEVLKNPELGDLYSRFDVYNILSELSKSLKDKEKYETLANDSLIEYIERIDTNNWKEYADSCIRVAEYVDWRIDSVVVKRYLEKAIIIMEQRNDNDECTKQINKCKSILKKI